jgi:hypothetical protein
MIPIHDGPVQNALAQLNQVIDATRSDKYTVGNIETVDFISDKNLGYNLGNAVKYITRFKSTKGEKNGNPNDLLKAAHYVLMELALTQVAQNDRPQQYTSPVAPNEVLPPASRPSYFVPVVESAAGQKKKSLMDIRNMVKSSIQIEHGEEPVHEPSIDFEVEMDGKKFQYDPVIDGSHLDTINPESHLPPEDLEKFSQEETQYNESMRKQQEEIWQNTDKKPEDKHDGIRISIMDYMSDKSKVRTVVSPLLGIDGAPLVYHKMEKPPEPELPQEDIITEEVPGFEDLILEGEN